VSWKRTAVLMVLSVVFGGIGMAQGQSSEKPPSDAAPPPEAPKVSPTTVDPNATVGVGVDPNSFLIGPGDVLYIEVFNQPRFTRPVGVRSDGKITLVIIGEMQAAGLTPNKLRDQIKEAYSASELINPIVDVTVTQVNSQKYTISGQIGRPGIYPLTAPTHVFDALNNCGGWKDFANKKKIKIVRGPKVIFFNYKAYLDNPGKDPDKNVLLQNGDTIIVE
jgi:polysaccharide export outer membrane protein